MSFRITPVDPRVVNFAVQKATKAHGSEIEFLVRLCRCVNTQKELMLRIQLSLRTEEHDIYIFTSVQAARYRGKFN